MAGRLADRPEVLPRRDNGLREWKAQHDAEADPAGLPGGHPYLWMSVVGGWLLLASVVASQDYVEGLLRGSRLSFPLLLAWAAAVLLYWVLVSPVILWLGRRLPVQRGLVVRQVALHLALACLVALIHAPLAVGVTVLLKPFPIVGELGPWRGLGLAVVYSFRTGLLLYWVILGGGAAFEGFRRARQRELRAVHLETELGRARLRALEAQLRPHFLFNALNTVSMMVRSRENDQAVQTIAELGELLRSSLRGELRHEVPLDRELELVGHYLRIEQRRFGDRLRVVIEVQPEAEQSLVPHLALQPLVENAVRHGISRSTGPGLVRVTSRIDGAQLLLEVHDNGPGLPPGWSVDTDCGIGLENVRTRLEQLYGPGDWLTLTAQPEGGTVVRLRVPNHTQHLPQGAG